MLITANRCASAGAAAGAWASASEGASSTEAPSARETQNTFIDPIPFSVEVQEPLSIAPSWAVRHLPPPALGLERRSDREFERIGFGRHQVVVVHAFAVHVVGV